MKGSEILNRMWVLLCFMLLSAALKAQSGENENDSTISISADKLKGCAPEAIKFTLNGLEKGTKVTWYIGNDTINNGGTEQTYLFAKGGAYTIGAAIKLPDGSDTEIVKKNFVTLGSGNTDIELHVSRTYLWDGPDTVSFEADAPGAVVFDWIIDGTNYPDAGNKVVHAFGTGGKKSVTVRIRDSFGCYTIKTFEAAVSIITPPVIDFKASVTKGCIPLLVDFTPNIKKGDSEITGWSWEFAGSKQQSSRLEKPSGILYEKPGACDVKLTVTTKDGRTFSHFSKSYISAGDTLTPSFTVKQNNTCPDGVLVYLNKSRKISGGVFSWNFPGGTVLPGSNDSVQYVKYTKDGKYAATLSYTNSSCNRYATDTIALKVETLKADFTADKFCNCRVPDTIRFVNRSVYPPNRKVTYEWTFYDADGTTILKKTNEQDPQMSFQQYGKYSVKLVITNENGCKDSVIKRNFLVFEKLDGTQFKIAPAVGGVGKAIQLKLSKIPHCSSATYSYEWIIYKKGSQQEVTRLYGASPSVKLYDSGAYNIRLFIKNSEGCSTEVEPKSAGESDLLVIIPRPGFMADTTYTCQEKQIVLVQKTSPDIISYTHNWILTLSSDTTVKIKGTGDTLRPVFTKPGVYDVKYQASFVNGWTYTKEVKDYLYISGIRADFTADKKDGCLPLISNLSAKILENLHFGDTSNAVTYQWTASPSNGVIFSDPNGANTRVTFSKGGYFTVRLTVTNSTGCSYTVSKNNFSNAGINASFNMTALSCYGKPVTVQNQSSRTASSFQWSSEPAGVIFYPSARAASPRLIFPAGGKYTITLLAKSKEGCSDSINRKITIQEVKAAFSSRDTINTCAPAYVSFTASGAGADSFTWYFGDGAVLHTRDTSVAHIYKSNTGDRSTGYTVTLVAKNLAGCVDTLVRQKYIKVLGPVPAFEISENKGCGPLMVNFTNQSKFTPKWYLDYGDYSTPDTSAFGPHIYSIQDPNAAYQVFRPRLLAKDDFGCSVWAYATDSVVVYRKPKAAFTIDNANLCYPEVLHLKSASSFAGKHYWDFNNDGTIDDTSRNPVVKLPEGTYTIKLKVENSYGCSDSVIMTNAVAVHALPAGRIVTTVANSCEGTDVSFSFQPSGQGMIRAYRWTLNGKAMDSTSGSQWKYHFNKDGNYQLAVELINEFGCTKTVSIPVSVDVPDTSAPAAVQLNYVTVENNSSVRISWEKSKLASFGKYKLYRQDGSIFRLVQEFMNAGDTSWLDQNTNVQQQSYNYRMQVENMCGKRSVPGLVHSSILLKVSATGTNALLIQWNSYKGWNTVKSYRIYKDEGSGYNLLAILQATDTQYVDDDLCDKVYAYYVVAQGLEFTSISNTASAKPIYSFNAGPQDVRYASVTDDNAVDLHWNAPDTAPDAYIIDRYEEGKGWEINYAYIHGNSLIDTRADVDHQSYSYRIRLQSHCGDISEAGRIGKSILLTGDISHDKLVLRWNHYREWKNGVNYYRIERKTEDNNWQKLGEVPGYDSTYSSDNFGANQSGDLMLRVVAVENAHSPEQSISNKIELIAPSHLYVPNAFSPNKDGLNEGFKAVGYSLETGGDHPYKMLIFNRWGEQIFEANSIEKGWDGAFKGQPVPEGTYIYVINAQGLDRHSYYLKGSFQLIR